MNITPDQFYKQWLRLGPAQATVSHFENQVLDFTATAGRFSQDRFQRSFEEGGFYGSGQKWPARTSRWGKRFTHPIMKDFGLLESSINGKSQTKNITHKPAPGRESAFQRFTSYSIVAAPVTTKNQLEKEEDGKKRKHRGLRRSGPTTYAAVHNAPASFGFWTNQYHKSRPVRRQFIGLNKKLDAEIARYYNTIFNGLPGVGNSPSPMI